MQLLTLHHQSHGRIGGQAVALFDVDWSNMDAPARLGTLATILTLTDNPRLAPVREQQRRTHRAHIPLKDAPSHAPPEIDDLERLLGDIIVAGVECEEEPAVAMDHHGEARELHLALGQSVRSLRTSPDIDVKLLEVMRSLYPHS